jgi:hypothetical protein
MIVLGTMRALFVLLVACGDSNPMPMPDAPGPPPGPPDIPDVGFHVPLASLDGFTYTAQFEAGLNYFREIVDTGSSDTAIASNQCFSCGSLLYKPGSSATDTGMQVTTQYADGSTWSGEVYKETMTWLRGPLVTTSIVAITQQTMFFDPSANYQGIIGLGPKELLDPPATSYMDALAAQYGGQEMMAFRLCPFSGDMWLEGYDPTAAASDVQFTPMLPIDAQNNPFYQIEYADITFGGTTLGVNTAGYGPVLVDTGTSISYIPLAALNSLLSQINNNAAFKTMFPGQTLANTVNGACVTNATATSEMVDAMLPNLSVSFPAVGGGTFAIAVPASSSYLYPAGGGQFCLAFDDATGIGTLIGDTLMTGMLTVFDVTNLQIGFAPQAGCQPFDPIMRTTRVAPHSSPFFRPPPRRQPHH